MSVLATEKNSTIILPLPIDLLTAFLQRRGRNNLGHILNNLLGEVIPVSKAFTLLSVSIRGCWKSDFFRLLKNAQMQVELAKSRLRGLPCLRRSACPPHEASGGGATRRQAKSFRRGTIHELPLHGCTQQMSVFQQPVKGIQTLPKGRLTPMLH